MPTPKRFALAGLLLAGTLMTGCGQQPPHDGSSMLLKSVGPDNIKAGIKFNVQPDGVSAAWLHTERVPKTAIPVLAGVELPSVNVRENGTLVTVIVPDKLTKLPGSYPLYLLDKASGRKSNQIQLVVK